MWVGAMSWGWGSAGGGGRARRRAPTPSASVPAQSCPYLADGADDHALGLVVVADGGDGDALAREGGERGE